LTTGHKNFEAVYEYELASLQTSLKAALDKNAVLEKRITFILDQKSNFTKKYKFFLSSHELFISHISSITSKLTALFYNLSDKKLKQFLSSKLVKNFENLELNFLSLHRSIKTYTDQTQIFDLLQSLNFDDLHEYSSDCENDSRNKTVSKISGSLRIGKREGSLDSYQRGVKGEKSTVKKEEIELMGKGWAGRAGASENLSYSGFDNDSFRGKIRNLNIEKVHSDRECFFGAGGALGDYKNQCYTDRSCYNIGARKSEKSDQSSLIGDRNYDHGDLAIVDPGRMDLDDYPQIMISDFSVDNYSPQNSVSHHEKKQRFQAPTKNESLSKQGIAKSFNKNAKGKVLGLDLSA
jgi:hypothetical protein